MSEEASTNTAAAAATTEATSQAAAKPKPLKKGMSSKFGAALLKANREGRLQGAVDKMEEDMAKEEAMAKEQAGK